MTDSHEIVTVDRVEIAEPVPVNRSMSVTEAVGIAIANSPTVETLSELLAFQREVNAEEAKVKAEKAKERFDEAMLKMLDDLPVSVSKNKRATYGKETAYTYADLSAVLNAVVPVMRNHGFIHRWKTHKNANGDLFVTCMVRYGGHTEEETLPAPPDTKGGKSGVQAIQSGITYQKRQSLINILGLGTEDSPDADEQSETQQRRVDPKLNARAVGAIRRAGLSLPVIEDIIGRPSTEWQVSDHAKVREWLDENAEKQPVNR